MGTSNSVSRALRLISESGLENGGVEKLAEKLGLGSRHLRRLFLRHLGATPLAVEQTRRLHFAKKLIDETRLPMGEIALAAGYGSVRRFNAHMRKTYKRTPREIRALARPASEHADNQYVFRLPFRPPLDWNGMLAFLAPRATPGVESVDQAAASYRRTLQIDGSSGVCEVTLHPEGHALKVSIHFSEARLLFAIVERLRSMFDLDADWREIAACLKTDPLLRPMLLQSPGLRPPGAWDGFELAVRAILGQQVTVKGATTLTGRLVQKFGKALHAADKALHAADKNQTQVRVISGLTHFFPTPEVIAEADVASIGLPAARAESIRALAQAVSTRQIVFSGVMDAVEFRRQLCELPGIGAWTAEYVAMRALRDPDAFPSSDLGLLKAAQVKSSRELEARSEPWRPWRAYAAMYLWNQLANGLGRVLGNSAGRSLVRAAASAVGSAVESELGSVRGEKHAAHVRTA
jgi:AraC family transcriptional regulator of adaptative response / DNA-3-methyladenine glycosylase II